MLKFLGKTLAGLVLTKEAQEVIGVRSPEKKGDWRVEPSLFEPEDSGLSSDMPADTVDRAAAIALMLAQLKSAPALTTTELSNQIRDRVKSLPPLRLPAAPGTPVAPPVQAAPQLAPRPIMASQPAPMLRPAAVQPARPAAPVAQTPAPQLTNPRIQTKAPAPGPALGPAPVSGDRASLIRHAIEIRRAKQSVLAELSEEQRQKLVALAMKTLLGQDPETIH